MREPLTTKDVLELGKMWGDNVFTLVPPEEAFSHYKAEDAVRFYKPEELLSHLQAEDVARFYKTKELLSHLQPKEVLSDLPQEEIEAYLQNLKSKKEQKQNKT